MPELLPLFQAEQCEESLGCLYGRASVEARALCPTEGTCLASQEDVPSVKSSKQRGRASPHRGTCLSRRGTCLASQEDAPVPQRDVPRLTWRRASPHRRTCLSRRGDVPRLTGGRAWSNHSSSLPLGGGIGDGSSCGAERAARVASSVWALPVPRENGCLCGLVEDGPRASQGTFS